MIKEFIKRRIKKLISIKSFIARKKSLILMNYIYFSLNTYDMDKVKVLSSNWKDARH
ncbi:hypothetical protein JoomaDRAFT_2304 [Galbibacter orientalis DSM 19592]|uniref:Uncharacterized protein n=1 Tax=Galbibacter orientalis DSM 19592 TaxID=926559 RepID=I3C6P9_9FLAO|nr:hypothetical protein JoomaDRAFT_2304 [Galbibacter orientalis DSM 19592]